jgi:hypothetical protein
MRSHILVQRATIKFWSNSFVVDAILPHMDSQDLLFVCELTNKYQGRLPKPAWDWINQELPEYNAFLAGLGFGGPPVAPSSPASIGSLLGSPTKEEENKSFFPLPPPWTPPKK